MDSNLYAVSAYQQASQTWKSSSTVAGRADKVKTASGAEKTAKSDSNVKTKEWNPIDTSGPLMPSSKDGYGMAIGDVQLSDKAKEYYGQLKSKFHNMDFIVVSQDMKSQVQANASAYGNASKQVVLIDDAKLEKMAEDEAYRKKYEGIIAMSEAQMASAKASLTSSGASIKNFGMSVNADGSTDFFATLEKSSDEQAKRLEKKQAEKKAAKAKAKKQAEKKEKEERLQERIEEKKAEKEEAESKTEVAEEEEDKEYVEIHADSMEQLLDRVSRYAYDNSAKSVVTEEEKAVGQNFDFKW